MVPTSTCKPVVCLCLWEVILVRALCLAGEVPSGVVFLPDVVILSGCQLLQSPPHPPRPPPSPGAWGPRITLALARFEGRWGHELPCGGQVLGPLSENRIGLCWAPTRHWALCWLLNVAYSNDSYWKACHEDVIIFVHRGLAWSRTFPESHS